MLCLGTIYNTLKLSGLWDFVDSFEIPFWPFAFPSGNFLNILINFLISPRKIHELKFSIFNEVNFGKMHFSRKFSNSSRFSYIFAKKTQNFYKINFVSVIVFLSESFIVCCCIFSLFSFIKFFTISLFVNQDRHTHLMERSNNHPNFLNFKMK